MIITGAEGSITDLCRDPHLYFFYAEKCMKMLENALTLQESNTPHIAVLFWSCLRATRWPWMQKRTSLFVVYRFHPSANHLKWAVVSDCERTFSYPPALGRKVKARTCGAPLGLIVSTWTMTVTVRINMIYRLTTVLVAVMTRSQDTSWSCVYSQMSKWYNICDFLYCFCSLSKWQCVHVTEAKLTWVEVWKLLSLKSSRSLLYIEVLLGFLLSLPNYW